MKELGLFIDMLPDGNYPGAVPPEEAVQDAEEARAIRAAAARVKAVVVHGPPASGKTTYVQQNKKENDVVFDFDKVMQALSGKELHEASEPLISYCLDIRDLIVQKARVNQRIGTTWIIATKVRPEFRRTMADLEPSYVRMEATLEECLQRVDEDPARAAVAEKTKQVIRDFFAEEAQASEPVTAAEGFVPPKGAQAEAAKGLRWREKFGRGGTAVGVARARDISNGKALSLDTIGRMVSYFARHEVDKQGEGWSPGQKGFPSAGRVAWALWGGDAGRRWAESVYKREKKD